MASSRSQRLLSDQRLLSKAKVSLPRIEVPSKPLRTLLRSPAPVQPAPHLKPAPRSTRVPKLSVSLYQHDLERLDTIKDFMKTHGFRNLSDSEALRLACRKVKIDGALIEVYKNMQGEDGRRKQA